MSREKMKTLLGEAKPFAHGTVRQWQRGNVMKHGTEWQRLSKDKPAPLQPVAAVAATSLGGNPYGSAQPFTAEMAGSLGAIADQMKEDIELAEKIQSPSTPKGRAEYFKSLGGWSKAATKVAASYSGKLSDMRQVTTAEQERKARLAGLLQTASDTLGQIAALSDSF